MARYGFIHTKEEIKYLILFAMDFLPFPVSFNTIVDLTTWCDEGFSYFELSEAFFEMLQTGHITSVAQLDDNEQSYRITPRGREAAKVFEKQLPFRRDMEQLFAIEMNVVSQMQATILEKNFKANAETIYQALLLATTSNDNAPEI